MKILKILLSWLVAAAIVISPMTSASAKSCSEVEIETLRSLLVPVTRISAHQGKNVTENQVVIAKVKELYSSSDSPRLKKQLKQLLELIREGELNQGSVVYWGYRENSVWQTYLAALRLSQKNKC